MLELSDVYQNSRFDKDNPLEAKFYVIDEMSMADTLLFARFLEAVPDDGIIVLVGDANQLPSVGPGRVLAELLSMDMLHRVFLSKVHRQGEDSNILELVDKISKGESDFDNCLVNKPDIQFIQTTNQNQIQKLIMQSFEYLYQQRNFDIYHDFQIIVSYEIL